MSMSNENKELLIGLGLKLAEMALTGVSAAAIQAWNKHLTAVQESERTGVPLTPEAHRAISAAIKTTGEDLLVIDTSMLDVPKAPPV